MLKIAVIVVNWNGRELTSRCLETLQASEMRPCRVIVFDNGSADGSVEWIRQSFPESEVLESENNLGFTGANNAAIRHALRDEIEAVWILNNDTEVHPGCLERLSQCLQTDALIGAVGPKILYADPPHRIWYGGAKLNPFSFRAPHSNIGREKGFGPSQPEEVDFITGCSLLIRREAIEKVGVFDDSYFAYGEDLDWCIRAKKAGFRLVYVPTAIIWHKVAASLRKNAMAGQRGTASPLAHYLHCRNTLWVMRRHARRPGQLLIAASLFLFRQLPVFAGMLLLGRFKKAIARGKGLFEGLFFRLTSQKLNSD